ncbi:MAG: hypothetical protein WBA61_10455 [Aequorivita sp.]
MKVLLPLSFLCHVAILSILFFNIDTWAADENTEAFLKMVGVIMILGFLFTILYLISIFLIAKIFKIAKMGHAVTWADSILEFILLWFYPIGIWIIQPRVNKMMDGKKILQASHIYLIR